MLFYNCLPTITKPTRITTHSSTHIDNIFMNAWPYIVDSHITVSDISDHYLPIITRFDFNITVTRTAQSSNFRKFNNGNKTILNPR